MSNAAKSCKEKNTFTQYFDLCRTLLTADIKWLSKSPNLGIFNETHNFASKKSYYRFNVLF